MLTSESCLVYCFKCVLIFMLTLTVFDPITARTPISAQSNQFCSLQITSHVPTSLYKHILLSTNNICFYTESQKHIAYASLNTPLIKSSADLSLKCIRIRRIFYYNFF